MAVRYYLTSSVGSGASRADARRAAGLPSGVPFQSMDYGAEPVFLVRVDLKDEQHAALAARSDVIAFPADLSAKVGTGAVLTGAKTKLESTKLPADWITSATTAGDAVKAFQKFCLVQQGVQGRTGKSVFDGGLSPDATVADLSKEQREAMTKSLESLGMSTDQVKWTTTVREVLKAAASAVPEPVFGGKA